MGSEDVSRNDTGETTLGETYKSRNVKLPMMFIFPRELSKYLGTESIYFYVVWTSFNVSFILHLIIQKHSHMSVT